MIGEKLKTILLEKGIRPGTLARDTGISKNSIYAILHRNNSKVDAENLKRIAEYLNVPVEYFIVPTENETDLIEVECLRLFRQLTAEQKSFIVASMRGLLLTSS